MTASQRRTRNARRAASPLSALRAALPPRERVVRVAAARPSLVAASLLIGLYGALSAAEPARTEPVIEAVRLGVDAEGQTRIVLDTDARPDFSIAPLSGDRLAIDVRGARFAAPDGTGTGVVTGYAANGTRLTLSLGGPALPVRSFVLEPSGDVSHWRLVVDLDAVSPAVFAAAIPGAAGTVPDVVPATAESPSLAREAETARDVLAALAEPLPPSPRLKPRPTAQPKIAQPDSAQPDRVRTAETARARPARAARRERVVVIDPGHGGHDPGASGPDGYAEEDANLAAALALRTILQARGYTVELTRDDDTYVDLAERIERARGARADLFLSLHADGLDDPTVRGASVYTLSDERAGQMARELRAEEGDFDVYQVSLGEDERDVGDILFDLASTSTRNESARLASLLVDELAAETPMLRNSHRKKSLRVLLSPDVPAVLVEMGFISNEEDEANLKNARWRRRTMGALADGIDAYFAEQLAAYGGAPGSGTGGAR